MGVSQINLYLFRRTHGVKTGGMHTNGFNPALDNPAATPTQFCSAMPISTNCPGSSLAKSPKVTEPLESVHITMILPSFLASSNIVSKMLFYMVRSSRSPPNSFTACASCSSVGTPWCHFATFSIKDTPLPFTVWAMIKCGFPSVFRTVSMVFMIS